MTTSTTAARELLPQRWAFPAVSVAVAASIVCAVLGYRYADATRPGRFDTVVDARVRDGLAPGRPLLSVLVHLGDPAVVVVLTALLALVCLRRGRPRAALLTVTTVPLGGALTEYVLKPLVHRSLWRPWMLRHPPATRSSLHEPAFTFPSGHTVGVFALVTCLLLVLLGAQRPTRARARLHLVFAAVAVGLAAGVAVAVVALHRHYATDAVGGAAVAVAVVLLGALTVDAAAARRPDGRRPRLRQRTPLAPITEPRLPIRRRGARR